MQELPLITNELIISKLKHISHPRTYEPVINFLSKIVINDGIVVFGIKANKAEIPVFEKLKSECEKAISNIDGIKKVTISLYSEDEETSKKAPLPNVKKIILVASGKGGVGKSTIAFNLALSLVKQGKRVGICDVDIYGPSLPQLSGIYKKPIIENNLVIPHVKYDLEMMSVGFLVDEGAPLVWRGPMTSKMLFQLLRMTNWGIQDQLDYLIIDTPPGTGDVHLSLAENYKIDGAIVVSTPQALATADAAKGIEMFNKMGIPVLGIIQNMSFFEDAGGSKHYIFGKDGATNLAKKYSSRLLGDIPIFQNLMESSNTGKPITLLDESSKASIAFKDMAIKLLDIIE